MDFGFTPAEERFRQDLQQWLRQNLPPGWLEGKREIPEEPRAREQFLRAWQRKMYEGGWAGIWWPEENGGRGASLIEQAIFDEELIRYDTPPLLNLIGLALVGPTLMQVGTPEQKQRHLLPILQGEEVWCMGFSEPNAGSDVAGVQTSAIDQGDHFLVNGQKIWTSYAQFADWCFLLCRTDRNLPKHKGLSALLVDLKSPGIEIKEIRQINGDAEFCEVFFTDVKVPKHNLVGAMNDGWRVITVFLMFERRSMQPVMRTEKYFPLMLEHCRTHQRNDVPLIQDPVIRDRLAQLYTEVQILRLTSYRGLTAQMRKGVPGPEGSIEKLYGTELTKRLQAYALELLGEEALREGSAYSGPLEGGIGYSYLSAFMGTIAGGTSEIQRNILAERVLGLPRD